MHVSGLSAQKASTGLDVVVAFRPANCCDVLKGVVNILKGHERAIAKIGEGTHRDRGQGVGKRTEGGLDGGKADRRIRAGTKVEREREVVDASEGCPQVEQEAWRENVCSPKHIAGPHPKQDHQSRTCLH